MMAQKYNYTTDDFFQYQVEAFTESNSIWNFKKVSVPIVARCTDKSAVIYYRPQSAGGPSTQTELGGYKQSYSGACFFTAPGEWYFMVRVVGAAAVSRTIVFEDLRLYDGTLQNLAAGDSPAVIPATPTFKTVTSSSGVIQSADATIKRLVLSNDSEDDTCSLAFAGEAAVSGSGMKIYPRGILVLEPEDQVAGLEIRGISSGANINLGYQAWR